MNPIETHCDALTETARKHRAALEAGDHALAARLYDEVGEHYQQMMQAYYREKKARNAELLLHPSMTGEQLAEWCATHRMIVTIEAEVAPTGRAVPRLIARPDVPDESIPCFLRRQAE